MSVPNTIIYDNGIKKDSRAIGKFFHHAPRCGATKAKRIAFSDILDEIGEGKLYDRNYVLVEPIVHELIQHFSPPYIPIL